MLKGRYQGYLDQEEIIISHRRKRECKYNGSEVRRPRIESDLPFPGYDLGTLFPELKDGNKPPPYLLVRVVKEDKVKNIHS